MGIAPNKSDAPLTTGQAARLLHVAPRTLAKWCDSGRIRHHRLPDSTDRRIFRGDLVAFAAGHGLPVPAELAPPVVLSYALAPGESVPGATAAASAFELGELVPSASVLAAVVGDADGLAAGLAACAYVRRHHPRARVVFVADPSATPAPHPAVDEFVTRPADLSALRLPGAS